MGIFNIFLHIEKPQELALLLSFWNFFFLWTFRSKVEC